MQSRDNKPEINSLLEPFAPFSEEIKIRTFSVVSRLTGYARIVGLITVKVVRLGYKTVTVVTVLIKPKRVITQTHEPYS